MPDRAAAAPHRDAEGCDYGTCTPIRGPVRRASPNTAPAAVGRRRSSPNKTIAFALER
jgi:hypothetical protein